MTRNKVAVQARRHRREKRDARRVTGGDEALGLAASAVQNPGDAAAGKELLSAVEMGGTAEARRKQLARALDRLAPDLEFNEDGDA